MNISVKEADNIKYNNILIDKLSISSISIDPLKRVANFTVSYWNGTVFLGNESYTYRATYTKQIESQPVLKSLSVSYPIYYNISIALNATINGTAYNNSFPFTSLFPYLTKNLQIYYNQKGDISLESSTDISTPTTASYAYGDKINGKDMLSIFYTVGDAQYNVKIEQPAQPKLCHGGITTLYTNSDKSSLSVTTDPINFNIAVPIGTNEGGLTVKSEPNTTVSNLTQTNIYKGYEATPLYRYTIQSLPTLTIYYNPNKISEIFATQQPGNYPQVSASFTSVILIKETASATYQFTNLSYKTNNNVTVTFPSKQLELEITSKIDQTLIFYNPLNTSDIGFQDDTSKYTDLINLLTAPANTQSATTNTANLLKHFNNITSTPVVTMDLRGALSI